MYEKVEFLLNLIDLERNDDYVQLLMNMHALHVEMPEKNDEKYFYVNKLN